MSTRRTLLSVTNTCCFCPLITKSRVTQINYTVSSNSFLTGTSDASKQNSWMPFQAPVYTRVDQENGGRSTQLVPSTIRFSETTTLPSDGFFISDASKQNNPWMPLQAPAYERVYQQTGGDGTQLVPSTIRFSDATTTGTPVPVPSVRPSSRRTAPGVRSSSRKCSSFIVADSLSSLIVSGACSSASAADRVISCWMSDGE